MADKIVLITGATSGIGYSCAKAFASRGGYRLIVTGRSQDKVQKMRQALSASCPSLGLAADGLSDSDRLMSLVVDVRCRDSVNNVVASLPSPWANIDVLVNNAGLALGLDTLDKASADDYETMIDTNLKGLLWFTKAVLPGMRLRNKGHIINIGSVAGNAGYFGGSVYCATKAAVATISDSLRIELVDTDIRVTNIKPGLVETNFSRTRFHGDKDRADNVYKGIVPLSADDIADAVLYAASAPEHVQIADMLILANHQANGSVISRK